MMPPILITLFLGAQLLNFPDHFLPPWIALFKEYPILNHGTEEGVKNKFKEFSQEPHCAVIVAHENNQIITGLIAGIPLKAYPNETELFQKNNLEPSHFYHINDLIIAPEYRKRGIATKLYKKLEKRVQQWGYKKMCLCIIEHKEDHPLKPLSYYDETHFWRHQGFVPTSIKIKESWPTLVDNEGTVDEMYEHTLVFFTKELQ